MLQAGVALQQSRSERVKVCTHQYQSHLHANSCTPNCLETVLSILLLHCLNQSRFFLICTILHGLTGTMQLRNITGVSILARAQACAGSRAPPGAAAAVVVPRRQPVAASAALQQAGVMVDPAAVDLAHRLADAAARVTTRYFRWAAEGVGMLDGEAKLVLPAWACHAWGKHQPSHNQLQRLVMQHAEAV